MLACLPESDTSMADTFLPDSGRASDEAVVLRAAWQPGPRHNGKRGGTPPTCGREGDAAPSTSPRCGGPKTSNNGGGADEGGIWQVSQSPLTGEAEVWLKARLQKRRAALPPRYQ